MKFALLGADAETFPLVKELVSDPDHQLTVAYQVPEALAITLKEIAPEVSFQDDWEALLHEPVASALIVSSHSHFSNEQQEKRADQLRKLTQAARPMLVTFPACESIVGFELEMIRRDVQGILVPYHPDLCDPVLDALIGWFKPGHANGPPGQLEQVTMERRIMERDVAVLRHQLTRDTSLIRQLVGEIRRVSGMGQAFSPESGPFHLTANFDSQQQALCNWSLCTTHQPYLARITLLVGGGPAELRLQPGTNSWQWEEPTPEWLASLDSPTTPRSNPARIMLDRFLQTLSATGPHRDRSSVSETSERNKVNASPSEHAPPLFSWMDACRAQEAAEAVERAVARGRTIELFNEEHSEEGTFKGIMAAGSCSLLMLTLFLLVVGSIIEGVRLPYARQRDRDAARLVDRLDDSRDAATMDRPSPRPLWIRLWPVYPLLLFLLLQTLNLVFVPAGGTVPAGGPSSGGDSGDPPQDRPSLPSGPRSP
jgi:hypothetical protein